MSHLKSTDEDIAVRVFMWPWPVWSLFAIWSFLLFDHIALMGLPGALVASNNATGGVLAQGYSIAAWCGKYVLSGGFAFMAASRVFSLWRFLPEYRTAKG